MNEVKIRRNKDTQSYKLYINGKRIGGELSLDEVMFFLSRKEKTSDNNNDCGIGGDSNSNTADTRK